MAIHTSTRTESTSGFEKVIDEASMSLALDVMQKHQYQFPQKSTIRELAANAVDSIKERDIAKLILSGRAKEEDYYVRRDDSEFKASNFNADYFDLKWLSNKQDVEIIYEESNIGRDKLRIIDEGVGLGGSRLEGYFKLNWSSKRNSKVAIGKFGMGAKAPLSTGVDSFRVTTRHNGKQFTFDVYSHKVDSVTEKFNEKGHKNPEYTFENGYTCYYEDTTLLNGTEIILETKKHHRALYTDAVRSQLLYMNGVKYKIKSEDGREQEIATKANVIYEDDDIILSDNTQYSKPHIVINNVCYGYINFEELESENKTGNIGIKMQAENIDISPSRENVIWADRTRKEVGEKFEKVVEIASAQVEKQLNEKDFGQWLVKCANVLTVGTSTNDILGRLSRVIDKSGLKPTYPLNKDIKYKTPKELLFGVQIRHIQVRADNNYRTGKMTVSVVREDLTSWGVLARGLYFTRSQANNHKDRYIASFKGDFVLMTLPEMTSEENFREGYKTRPQVNTPGIFSPPSADIAWAEYKAKFEKQQVIIDLLLKSSLTTDYDTVVVPDDFIKKLEATEKTDPENAEKVVELSPAEKRKLDERIVCYYPKWTGYAVGKSRADGTSYNTFFEWVKHEPKIKEVNDWENVVYCYSDEDEQLLIIAWILGKQSTNKDQVLNPGYFGADIKLVRIAKGLSKHFKQFTHVEQFYKQIEESGKLVPGSPVNRELIMHNLFVKWYTGKLIAEGLETVKFLSNFSAFNQDISDKYNELKTYQTANYIDLGNYYRQNLLGCDPKAFDAITGFASKVLDLQLLVDSDASADDIKAQSQVLFNEELTGAQAVDMDMYKKLQEVMEYAIPLKGILNYIGPLVNNWPAVQAIPYELESEIKTIMSNKGYDS
jgi:hypothetical protein